MEPLDQILIQANQVKVGLVSHETRNAVLRTLAQLLREQTKEILNENQKDLEAFSPTHPMFDRLLLNSDRLNALARDVEKITTFEDPLGKKLEQKNMPNGLNLEKRSVPLGVVAVIYESRPNVTVDVFALCFKAGNACVLKGGKEAKHSNEKLTQLIHQALKLKGVPTEAVSLITGDRTVTEALLKSKGKIDVCIPRGSQALIEFVRDKAKIPVIETGAGIVHVYFDAQGDVEKGRKIIFNSKTRRVSVCNALDTLIVHQSRLKDLFSLLEKCSEKNVEIYADEASFKNLDGKYPAELLKKAQAKDFGIEFLDFKMSVKTVSSLREALNHIETYSSKHTEAIVTEDPNAAEQFLNEVDAAAVMVNASTAFTDGGCFGLGAEIGISTQKLHARGPMGLAELTSYKWVVVGDGQVRI